MKNLKHIFTGMTVLGSISAMLGDTQSQTKVAQNPIVNFSNTTTIDIQKVELSDSATKVHVQAHFRPHFWIKIASETYLNADGKKFALTGAENIVPDSLFWMPDSGVADFTLSFEPLPLSTTSFDFIEGDEDGDFKLWNVDISGKEVAEFPDGVPSELKNTPEAETIPDPAFEVGETTVRIHLLPYIKELTNTASLYVDGMDGTQNEYTVNFDDKGEGSVSFKQYGTANAFLVDPNSYSMLDMYTLYPGETVDCYVDLWRSRSILGQHEGLKTCEKV